MAYFVLEGDVTVAITREYDLNDDLSYLPDDHEKVLSPDKKRFLVTNEEVVTADQFGLEESRYQGTPGSSEFVAQEQFIAFCDGFDLITEAPELKIEARASAENVVKILIVSDDLDYTENRDVELED
ncbi:hypothetical protein DXK93_18645 [Achromobacter sp. K91]|uniref:hypothetical protein n=1 Tax=Achromobacter sp. K91 TaxID=2292262 RepID=UPI000E6681AF|nr:hypothetical protein [Achromobacter sp. K91]RIJ02198.1 hypothetical protein DXK93_18645 [Achromobacter sp. K91]